MFCLCVLTFIDHYAINLFHEGDGKQVNTYMVEAFDKEGNDGHQTSTFKFDQQSTSRVQMDFANNNQNIGVPDFDVENQVYFTLLIAYIKLYDL